MKKNDTPDEKKTQSTGSATATKSTTKDGSDQSANKSTNQPTKRKGDSEAESDSDGLHELYLNELKDIYSAENQISKALPAIIKAVEDEGLKEALSDHLAETLDQAKLVNEIAQRHGEKATGEHCDGMEGLLKEGKAMIEDYPKGSTRDAALISACQKVEHYEIAGYGTLRVFASLLGYKDDVRDLNSILMQERAADEKMTQLAMESGINEGALSEDDSDSEPMPTGRAGQEKK